MQAAIDLDLREFERTLAAYADASQRDYFEIVTAKGFQLAGGYGNGALQLTHRADAEKIARELSLKVETAQRVNKKGKTVTRRKLSFGSTDDDIKNTFAGRIVNWRRVQSGQQPIWGKELAKAAERMTKARIRAANFVRSGWLASIRALAPLVGRGQRTDGAKEVGRPKGFTHVSRARTTPSVTILNFAMNTQPASGEGNEVMQKIAEEGLRRAVVEVTKDMLVYIERKMQKTADRHNAR